MALKPVAIRLDIVEHKLIADEMAAADVRFSEGARRLIHRGAGKPQPTYLKAQVSCQAELDQYANTQESARQLYSDIGGLIRAKLPADADPETVALVATARKQFKELLQLTLEQGTIARHLAKKMMGIGSEELRRLQESKRYLSDIIARHQKYLAAGESSSMKPETLQALEQVLAVLKGLGI